MDRPAGDTGGNRPGHPCIVAGYDGSEASTAAVLRAAARVGDTGRLIVVYASPSDEEGQAMLDALLMEKAEILADVDVDLRVSRRTPSEAIVHLARLVRADEVAVGTRGAGRLGSLIGSVAQDVLHKAECPVLAIPERAVAAAPSGESVQAST